VLPPFSLDPGFGAKGVVPQDAALLVTDLMPPSVPYSCHARWRGLCPIGSPIRLAHPGIQMV
jgi:hypothetical protein